MRRTRVVSCPELPSLVGTGASWNISDGFEWHKESPIWLNDEQALKESRPHGIAQIWPAPGGGFNVVNIIGMKSSYKVYHTIKPEDIIHFDTLEDLVVNFLALWRMGVEA